MSLYKEYRKIIGSGDDRRIGKESFKNESDVEAFDSYAGILENNIVLVDVDTRVQANLLDDILYKEGYYYEAFKTPHGKHFLFKSANYNIPHNTYISPIGITFDFKDGSKDVPQTLKLDKVTRKKIVTCEGLAENPDIVPLWLMPLCKPCKKTNNLVASLQGRKDGRYNALFDLNALLYTQHAFTREECMTTLDIINRYVFDSPISDERFNKIVRPETYAGLPRGGENWARVLTEDKKEPLSEFAKKFIGLKHVAIINGCVCMYDTSKGVYTFNYRQIQKEMLALRPHLMPTDIKNVYELIEMQAPKKGLNDNYINFKNGLYNLKDRTLKAHTFDVITYNQIPHNLKMVSENVEVVDKFFDDITCSSKNRENQLYEMIGYSLLSKNPLNKGLFYLTGEGSNGKSTLLDTIEVLFNGDLGEEEEAENASHLSVKDCGSQFNADLFGKLINIADDESAKFIDDDGISRLKKISGGVIVRLNKKYSQPFDAKLYSNIWLSCNKLPKTSDKTDGTLRRMSIVAFNAQFKPGMPGFDPEMGKKLQVEESIEYILYKSILALHNIIDNKGFTETEEAQEELNKYEVQNNNVLSFLQEFGDEVYKITAAAVYDEYEVFCKVNKCPSVGRNNFYNEVNKALGTELKKKRLNGRPERCFAK